MDGPEPIEILARVAAQLVESDRAIAALQKLLSIPYEAPLASGVPLTRALLRFDPMFHPLRNDPRFQKTHRLADGEQHETVDSVLFTRMAGKRIPAMRQAKHLTISADHRTTSYGA